MRCADCRDSLNALIDDEIDAADATRMRDHLAGCAECQREHRLLADASATLKERTRAISPHPTFSRHASAARSREPHPFDRRIPVRRTPWLSLVAAGLSDRRRQQRHHARGVEARASGRPWAPRCWRAISDR